MHIVRPIATATLLLLTACMDTPTMATTPTPENVLERTRWSLVDSQLASPAPDDRSRVRLEFRDGRMSANSGCNQGTGAYEVSDDRLIVAQMATTRRACIGPAAAYEPLFFALLTSRPTVRRSVDGTELLLDAGDGSQGSLRFLSEQMPSANAMQKFIYVAAERVPCTGVAPMQCLQVRDEPGQPWRLHYGEIIGFTPEPGIEYRLRILEDDVPHPPADGSSKRWFLDLVVEQKVVSR